MLIGGVASARRSNSSRCWSGSGQAWGRVAIMSSFVVVSERKIYPPANECIYCGARGVKFTDEHTFPDGLLGQHILPKASCEPCQKIINEQVEQYCMRTLFAHLRAVTGMRSAKKRPPPPLTVKLERQSGEIERVVVDPADLPQFFSLPVFPGPCFLTGEPVGETFDGWWWHHETPGASEALRKLGAQSMVSETVFPSRIARLVAKIAHSQAWALWGPAFEPFLPDVILGKTKYFQEYVGGWGKILNPVPDFAHTFKVMNWRKTKGDKDSYLIGEIRFFSDLGGPVYYAVIGKALKPWPFQERTA